MGIIDDSRHMLRAYTCDVSIIKYREINVNNSITSYGTLM